MRKTGLKVAAIVLCSTIPLAFPAQAGGSIYQILTKESQSALCTDSSNGEFYVNKKELATAIFTYLKLPLALTVEEESTREGVFAVVTSEEIADYQAKYPGLLKVKVSAAQIQTFKEVKLSLQTAFVMRKNKQSYAFQTEALTVDTGVDFLINPKGNLRCLEPLEGKQQEAGNIFLDLASYIRVRGAVKDLGKKDIKKASSAEISYKNDIEGGESTFKAKGVVGFPINALWGGQDIAVIPYLDYQATDIRKKLETDDRTETLAVGALVETRVNTGDIKWKISVAPNYLFDREKDTETWNVGARFDPAFTIGDNFAIGRFNLSDNGNIWVKPSAALIAQAASVQVSGSNPIFNEEGAYYGAGAELGLDVRFRNIPFLDKLAFETRFRYIRLFSLPIEDAVRWSISASYALNDAENVTLKTTYEDGRNMKTFEDEETWFVGLGVRF